jgi:hypothetical protein
MLKKLLIATAAAAAIAVPLAAVASADPTNSNGVPGTNSGVTPGSLVKGYNQSGQPLGPPGPLLGPEHGFSSLGHLQGNQ